MPKLLMSVSAMNRHNRKARNEWMSAAALLIAVICIFVFIPPVFRMIDCANAKKQVQFTELCEAHNNCSLSARELQRHKNYIRLMLRSCPVVENEL